MLESQKYIAFNASAYSNPKGYLLYLTEIQRNVNLQTQGAIVWGIGGGCLVSVMWPRTKCHRQTMINNQHFMQK
jgi:hypothetical protein